MRFTTRRSFWDILFLRSLPYKNEKSPLLKRKKKKPYEDAYYPDTCPNVLVPERPRPQSVARMQAASLRSALFHCHSSSYNLPYLFTCIWPLASTTTSEQPRKSASGSLNLVKNRYKTVETIKNHVLWPHDILDLVTTSDDLRGWPQATSEVDLKQPQMSLLYGPWPRDGLGGRPASSSLRWLTVINGN